jgi:hypothetical protein
MWIVLVRLFTILFVLTLAACERKEVASQEEKGSEESPGPARSPGPPGPAGSPGGTAIRVVDGECRQICTVACQANERILNAFALVARFNQFERI